MASFTYTQSQRNGRQDERRIALGRQRDKGHHIAEHRVECSLKPGATIEIRLATLFLCHTNEGSYDGACQGSKHGRSTSSIRVRLHHLGRIGSETDHLMARAFLLTARVCQPRPAPAGRAGAVGRVYVTEPVCVPGAMPRVKG